MTKIIGITGGIGSGKSTVSRILDGEWCPVFITDIEARIIQLTDPRAISGMKELFGNDIYLPDGKIDKQKLASIVFSDKSKLQSLNNLIHPLVKEKFEEWKNLYSELPFVAMESAILVQSGFHSLCDFNILVTAPMETRIERVMVRDVISREQVIQRINNQLSDCEIMSYCKYTINNDGDTEELKKKVADIMEKEYNKISNQF
ncbi:MAG: dephospho-CoA kinase [Bacteroidales bacterium]|nr:dephospho-CoA kinase [Bacteroidales bacterium]